MVEVFKTTVRDSYHATLVLEQIHRTFPMYDANFDLDDCDRILRVMSLQGDIKVALLITILKNFGFSGEILRDQIPSDNEDLLFSRRELLN